VILCTVLNKNGGDPYQIFESNSQLQEESSVILPNIDHAQTSTIASFGAWRTLCQCGFVYDSENEHVSDVQWLLGSDGCLHRNIIAIIEAIKTY